ncbi:MAG: 3-methyl-2-oxobutanoate hydroxymethyltransferase [Nitrososphaeraceae archaeon]|jgi:3-methyl-2-oxobutanoate hydroxymethyltransferase
MSSEVSNKSNGRSTTQNKFFTGNSGEKLTVNHLLEMKKKKEKVAIVTAYDYFNALICDRAGVDGILIGDSAAMVMLGYHNTAPIGMQEMLVFCGAVTRAVKRALTIGDLPFGSYQCSVADAVHNAVLFIKAGCNAVKIEGGTEVVPLIRSIIAAGIPVMGHIGFTPQTSSLWNNNRLHGKTEKSALKLLEDARELEEAGAFSVVLEMVTDEVATLISENLSIPTIGIGSGLNCDGQVLVSHDLLGLYQGAQLRFVKHYAHLYETIFEAISLYRKDVKEKKFPQDTNSFHMDKNELRKVLRKLKQQRKLRND